MNVHRLYLHLYVQMFNQLAIFCASLGQVAKRIQWKFLGIVGPRDFEVQIGYSLEMTSTTTALTVHLYK